jgi:hypothetical protein
MASLRCLEYGSHADDRDDYTSMVESMAFETVYRFCRAVVAAFGSHYLREPNEEDTAWILARNEARGFLGMLLSIDCMYLGWKNCPFGWKEYTRITLDSGVPCLKS